MGTIEQLSHTLSYWVDILNTAKKYFSFKCLYIWQTCTFIVYLYDYAATTTILNLFTKILTVFFQMPIFGVVEIKTAISPKPTQIFYSYFQIFLFLSNTLTDKRLKTKPIKLSKFAFSAVGLLTAIMYMKENNRGQLCQHHSCKILYI